MVPLSYVGKAKALVNMRIAKNLGICIVFGAYSCIVLFVKGVIYFFRFFFICLDFLFSSLYSLFLVKSLQYIKKIRS